MSKSVRVNDRLTSVRNIFHCVLFLTVACLNLTRATAFKPRF